MILQQDFFATRRAHFSGNATAVRCEELECAYWDGEYIGGPLPQCSWCADAGGDLVSGCCFAAEHIPQALADKHSA